MKRIFDLSLSCVLLIVLAPAMVLIAIAIVARLGRPLLFRQTRAGLHAEPFTLFKFQTMQSSGAAGSTAPDSERMTPLGSWLRSMSLDELPQLWNVIRGEMSLVGPRPLFMEYVSYHTPQQMRRYEVRPGLTGWAQVNGRNALTWTQKFQYDTWYVDHRSTRLDLRILGRTVGQVLTRRGIAGPGSATMEPFRGTDSAGDAPTPR